MPRVTSPKPIPDPELTIAELVERGATPAEILRFAKTSITAHAGRASYSKRGPKEYSKMGRKGGLAKAAKKTKKPLSKRLSTSSH